MSKKVITVYFIGSMGSRKLNKKVIIFTCFTGNHYWEDLRNRKWFFECFARSRDFDPLVPANWYNVLPSAISESKRTPVLQYYSGNLAHALMDVFPNIGLEESKFIFTQGNYWQDTQNKLEFFETFAKKKHFDPLVAENWYTISHQELRYFARSQPSYARYEGNFIEYLMEIYPSFGLQEEKFLLPQNYFQDVKKRRNFFVKLAVERGGFDPLVPDNWYPTKKKDLLSTKGAYTILRYYSGSLAKALVHLFPGVKFDETKFHAEL